MNCKINTGRMSFGRPAAPQDCLDERPSLNELVGKDQRAISEVEALTSSMLQVMIVGHLTAFLGNGSGIE